ncbi:HNH endonuclease [Vibrio sp. JC009]|uniref:HNH endonuclease n=1 Tax=Vibrio sp. JC009 TaxID=2912314 RepID=UPI0023AEB676|nr:HNH endonuclease [Vibrio sp. JC009]WED23528.1 HNH endonuclease [Vibrio sp. JC009]
MDKSVAIGIRKLLKKYHKKNDFSPKTIEQLDAEPLSGFHHWADGKEFQGGYLVSNNSGFNTWVLLIDWNGESDHGYYVVLFPENKAGPIAEIHESNYDSSEPSLTWRYTPKKRDGRNDERKSYFEKHFLSLNVEIAIPQSVDQVSDFLNELVVLAENRVKADVLDPNTPEQRDGFPEGKHKERLHKSRERNSNLIKEVKNDALARDGRLLCQCCGFDFEKQFGDLGKGFMEAHHTKPVSELMPEGDKTRKEDIALVCSNCHRMLHRRRPWLDMASLKELIKKK